jgi:hypothetical protein
MSSCGNCKISILAIGRSILFHSLQFFFALETHFLFKSNTFLNVKIGRVLTDVQFW